MKRLFQICLLLYVTFVIMSISSNIVIADESFEMEWSNSDKILMLDFKGKLKYNTTYMITIGKAKAVNGEFLLDYPYTFNFTTEEEPVKSTITVIYPEPGMQFNPGEVITVFGSTSNIKIGVDVEISISNKIFLGKIETNGNWSIEIKLPVQEGLYDLKVQSEDINTSVLIKIKSTKDRKDDETKNKGILGFGSMFDLMLVALIIIIILLAIFYIIKKRREEEFIRDDFDN